MSGVKGSGLGAASLAVGAIATWIAFRLTHIQSDDASQLVLVHSLRRVGFGGAVLSEDHFLLRTPLAALGLLLGGGLGRAAAMLTTTFVVAACCLCVVAFDRVVGRRPRPFACVFAIGAVLCFAPMQQHIVRPLGRGLEVLVAIAVSAYLCRVEPPSRSRSIAAIAVLATALSSDPYGRWIVVAPLAGLIVIGAVVSPGHTETIGRLRPFVTLGAAFVGSFLVDRLVVALGFSLHRFPINVRIAALTPAGVWRALATVGRLVLPEGSLHTGGISYVLRAIVLVVIVTTWIWAIVVEIRRREWSDVRAYALALPGFVVAAYIASGHLEQPADVRYLVPMFFAFPLSLSVLSSSTTSSVDRSPLVGAARRAGPLAVAFCSLAGSLMFVNRYPLGGRFLAEERAWSGVRRELAARHLDYGYTSYWESHRSTLLSGGALTSIPTGCSSDSKSLSTYSWLVNAAVSHRVGPTYLLIDPELSACESNLIDATLVWSEPSLGWRLYTLPTRPDWGLIETPT
jgi:hypothetical protein